MNRRNFLRNSIGALLFGSLSNNKILANVVELIPEDSTKVLLYKIQNKNGYWFIRGTRWIDIAKNKINQNKYNIDTFESLMIVDNNIANEKRLELWKKYNCGGGRGGGICFPLNVNKSIKNQKIATNSENLKKYNNSELKKINASIAGKKLAEKGIPQKNLLKINNLPYEKKLDMYKKSALSRIGRKASNEHRQNISNSLKNKPKSNEHKQKLSILRKGKKQSKETIEKKKILFRGEGNPMYGKNHTDKTKKLISDNHASKVILRCEYCKKECGANNFKRYHGDNCKNKKSLT